MWKTAAGAHRGALPPPFFRRSLFHFLNKPYLHMPFFPICCFQSPFENDSLFEKWQHAQRAALLPPYIAGFPCNPPRIPASNRLHLAAKFLALGHISIFQTAPNLIWAGTHIVQYFKKFQPKIQAVFFHKNSGCYPLACWLICANTPQLFGLCVKHAGCLPSRTAVQGNSPPYFRTTAQ